MSSVKNTDPSLVWRYIPYKTYSGPINMAIDESLALDIASGKCPNTLRFYKWFPSCASIGRHQSLNAEINRAYTTDHGIEIVRRISGGGAVFHDNQGEITYAVICHLKDLPKYQGLSRMYEQAIPTNYRVILEALVSGLESLGISIDVGKIHCPILSIQGKKFSGNAQAIIKGVLLQHGTILLHVDADLMYRVLKAPIGVPYSRMVQSVRTKVIGIHDLTSNEGNIKQFDELTIVNALKSGFEHIFGITFNEQSFSLEEMQKIEILAETKYRSEAWLTKYP